MTAFEIWNDLLCQGRYLRPFLSHQCSTTPLNPPENSEMSLPPFITFVCEIQVSLPKHKGRGLSKLDIHPKPYSPSRTLYSINSGPKEYFTSRVYPNPVILRCVSFCPYPYTYVCIYVLRIRTKGGTAYMYRVWTSSGIVCRIGPWLQVEQLQLLAAWNYKDGACISHDFCA